MTTLAAVSDQIWLALIAAGVVIIPIIVNNRAAKQTRKEAREDARMARSAEILAAVKVKEVKTTLEESTAAFGSQLDSIAKTGQDTHVLVNARMGAQLKLNMIATRRLADMTKGQPGGEADEEAAKLAESLYREHEKKQAIVDLTAGDKAKA